MVVPASRTARQRPVTGRVSRRRAPVLATAAVTTAALAGAVALAGCSNSTGGVGDTGYVASQTTGVTAIAAADRVAAPSLSGTTLDGKKLSLADYRGKVVVINVWGSWCTPCRVEG